MRNSISKEAIAVGNDPHEAVKLEVGVFFPLCLSRERTPSQSVRDQGEGN